MDVESEFDVGLAQIHHNGPFIWVNSAKFEHRDNKKFLMPRLWETGMQRKTYEVPTSNWCESENQVDVWLPTVNLYHCFIPLSLSKTSKSSQKASIAN
jgi:hypothetical protein